MGKTYETVETGGLAVSERASLGERIAALESLVTQAMELERIRDETIRREVQSAVAEVRSAVTIANEQILLRFENVNEWRQTYGDMARQTISKVEFDTKMLSVDEKIEANTAARIAVEAKAEERDNEFRRVAAGAEARQKQLMWRVGLLVTIGTTLIGLVMRVLKL